MRQNRNRLTSVDHDSRMSIIEHKRKFTRRPAESVGRIFELLAE
jgi:hypothetical protein